MAAWRPQLYRQTGRQQKVDPVALKNAVEIGKHTISVHPDLPPVFTLRHLAHLTSVDYGLLRAIIRRELEDPYKVFRIKKAVSDQKEKQFRIICVPDPGLMQVQKWISKKILSKGKVHSASVAYQPGSKLLDAATVHCNCRWLIKLDVRNFFESISEISVYRSFLALGYQPLVAFEMARLCTRLGSNTVLRRKQRWRSNSVQYPTIKAYQARRMGHLPQGAPTSPMLSNLAMYDFDERISTIADQYNLTYTRYADDMCLSSQEEDFTRGLARTVIGAVYTEMARSGLSPNVTKTRIATPGARKIVLGLVVDGDRPRLPREFRARLRQHLYYLQPDKAGPVEHAKRRNFGAVAGLRNHVRGLITFARQIEPTFAKQCEQLFAKVVWPL